MARPKKMIRSVEKTVCLDEDIVAKVELFLFSDLEGRVPFGSWKTYITELIKRDLDERNKGK